MAPPKPPHDFTPAIMRYLTGRSKCAKLAQIVSHLGAQDAWDRVQRALQALRKQGVISYLPGRGWTTMDV